MLSIENTIKVNREQLSNRILELETENEGLKKQIKSQCSRTDDILKRVRKLESRITENEKNKISIQPVVAGLDDNSDVIPLIPVENRFEILSEKRNSVIPPNQMLYSPQTDVPSKTRPEEGNMSKQSESFITGGLPQRVATNLGAPPKVYLQSQVPTNYEQKYPTFFLS